MSWVTVLALDRVIPFGVGGSAGVFGTADGPDGAPLHEMAVCTVDGRPVPANAGFTLAVDHGTEAFAEADTIVLPAVHPLGAIGARGRLPAQVAGGRRARPHPGRHPVGARHSVLAQIL